MTKTKKTAELSLIAALIVVLTIACTFIKFGPFSITLALVPIIVGASIYGPAAGAFLGALFSVVVLVTGLMGWDGGTVMYLISIHPIAGTFICLIKGTAAGFVSGLVFKAFEKKNLKLATLLAGIAAPVVNTGLFVLLMMVFYMSTLTSWANGQAVGYFIIFGLTGVNFLIELVVNIVLSAAVTSIIKYRKAHK